jgi:succinyl-CoA synthetase beta subunit
LRESGIPVPEGDVATSPAEVHEIAQKIGKPVVLKIQLWATGRAGLGGIQLADNPEEAEEISRHLLGMEAKNVIIDKILVEEKLKIKSEFLAGLIIDDAEKCPLLIFSSIGGTGIEEIAHNHPDKIAQINIDILKGLEEDETRNLLKKLGISGKLLQNLSGVLAKLYKVARKHEARSVEINPLVLTEDDLIYAADCHLAIDDHAAYRHPELDIEIAREFDRPPSALEKIAYQVERKDNRGTFYFLQMVEEIPEEGKFIGFHGAGGGGSMMSMDSVLGKGFKLANYCDTSGNPPASKVYRATKIILSQPCIKGYFASGSGVASQEQYHSARGFVKAFNEEKIKIPCVIRLGGNYEEKAIEILGTYLENTPAKVEGYGRDDSPESCAKRLEELIKANREVSHEILLIEEPAPPPDSYSFETITGELYIDHAKCLNCKTKGCISACSYEVLKLENDKPVLAISPEDAKKGKCTECLACEIFCAFHEHDAIIIHLPIPGLKEYRDKVIEQGKK